MISTSWRTIVSTIVVTFKTTWRCMTTVNNNNRISPQTPQAPGRHTRVHIAEYVLIYYCFLKLGKGSIRNTESRHTDKSQHNSRNAGNVSHATQHGNLVGVVGAIGHKSSLMWSAPLVGGGGRVGTGCAGLLGPQGPD